ncbi:TrmH family RNA methyltransferase [Sandaracinobacteroides saxicola]|uniref:RNA methyltransferase n=1 Tax=Sandaracinobacteroides saxicola TaxID=2759707 RepID=A0A7G5IDW3_9SPHN|nr:RNA methyltransferase [Sandaracinobacteroides saxicola]QMW21555.1 RNA methyltransferase [Sandaracinobacteroides saxicola]
MVSPELVTSASNTTLKRLRSLSQKKYRRAENLFLAEGLRIVTEATEAGWTPRILVFATAHRDHPLVRRLVQLTLHAGGRALETTPDILSTLSGKDNPQSVLAAFEPRPLSLADLDPHSAPRWLVAQSLKDPGNLGTMLRTCDATGAGALILLDDSADPLSVEAIRASMGAYFTVPCLTTKWPDFLTWLRHTPPAPRSGERGVEDNAKRQRRLAQRAGVGASPPSSPTLIGAALDPRARPYTHTPYPAPSFILMGNEQAGLPADYRDACDYLAAMPMLGKADSLNVAIAAAVLLYQALAVQS